MIRMNFLKFLLSFNLNTLVMIDYFLFRVFSYIPVNSISINLPSFNMIDHNSMNSPSQIWLTLVSVHLNLSRDVRKPDFCICENKNREADQRLWFHHLDSTIPLLSKPEIPSLWPSSVAVQPCLCGTWSKTPKTGFLMSRLIWEHKWIDID